MSSLDKVTENFEDRRLVERFAELLIEVRSQAQAAAPGTIIDSIERSVLRGGRGLLREVAEREIQAATDAAEKKGRATARSAANGGATRVRKSVT